MDAKGQLVAHSVLNFSDFAADQEAFQKFLNQSRIAAQSSDPDLRLELHKEIKKRTTDLPVNQPISEDDYYPRQDTSMPSSVLNRNLSQALNITPNLSASSVPSITTTTAPKLLDFNMMAPTMGSNSLLTGTSGNGMTYAFNPTNSPINLGVVTLSPNQMAIDEGNGLRISEMTTNASGEKVWQPVSFIPGQARGQALKQVTVANIPSFAGDQRQKITFNVSEPRAPTATAVTVQTPQGAQRMSAGIFDAQFKMPEADLKPKLNQFIFERAVAENKAVSVDQIKPESHLAALKPQAETVQAFDRSLYVLDVTDKDVERYVNDYIAQNFSPADQSRAKQTLEGFVQAASPEVKEANGQKAAFISPIAVNNPRFRA